MSPNSKAEDSRNPENTEKAQLWQLLLHNESMRINRTHVFLVAEAMLVVAYSIVLTQATKSLVIFAVGGLGLSCVWLILQCKAFGDMAKLSARVRDTDVSRHYTEWRAECKGFMASHEMTAIVIPALALVGWFLVLAFR